MKVVLFGASGMVGQGVLRECLLDPEVSAVLSIVRRASPTAEPKLRQLVHTDFTNYGAIEPELAGYDACFFCLGVSSAGMSEADYSRVTYDFTLRAAEALLRQNPSLTFVYVSGASTDSSEQGRTMWARVKGKTENALLALPFKAAYMFRPGLIQPLHGVTSRTPLYRALYTVLAPLVPLLKAIFPKQITTTERIGRAMLNAVRQAPSQRIFESTDINALAGGTA
jgi:uncharacterized protein YbjT (DUF2867 family)